MSDQRGEPAVEPTATVEDRLEQESIPSADDDGVTDGHPHRADVSEADALDQERPVALTEQQLVPDAERVEPLDDEDYALGT